LLEFLGEIWGLVGAAARATIAMPQIANLRLSFCAQILMKKMSYLESKQPIHDDCKAVEERSRRPQISVAPEFLHSATNFHASAVHFSISNPCYQIQQMHTAYSS
jgi:hypothetical protein